MKNILYIFILAGIITSCGNENNDHVFKNDFDQLGDWQYQSPMLKKGNAHSGIYYCGLDSTNDYSITFQRDLRDFPVQNVKIINASAWVRTKSLPSKATLIVTIDSVGGAVKYMGLPLKDFVTAPDQWTEIKGSLEAPESLHPDFFLKVYLYNVGKENVDIDDIRFEIE